MSLLDRIIDGLHDLFYSQKKSVNLGSRFVAVAIAFLTITTIFPTLAEDNVPVSEVVESPTPQASPAPERTSTATPIEPVVNQSEAPSPEPSTSPTDEEAKVMVAKVQPRINFRFPNSVALDPRASVVNLPNIAISGGKVGLVCLTSNGVIDLSAKGVANNENEGSLLIAGDLSTQVRVSGSLSAVSELINSAGGLRVTAAQGRVVNSTLTARYVELSDKDLSADFCGKATNQRTIAFRALGLQMDTVKTRVDFNKPSGK